MAQVGDADMKVKLVFNDWKFGGKSVYNTEEGVELAMGDFHSGTTLTGEIDLDREQEQEMRTAILAGYQPCFWISALGE
jgi:hypothetical protein